MQNSVVTSDLDAFVVTKNRIHFRGDNVFPWNLKKFYVKYDGFKLDCLTYDN